MLDFIKKYSKWASWFILGAALIAVYKTFDSFEALLKAFGTLFDAVKPFIIAFVIAYLLNIPVKRLNTFINEKIRVTFLNKHSNAFSIAAVYIIFLIGVAVILSTLLPALYKNILDMYNNLPYFVDTISGFINNIELLDKLGVQAKVTDIYSVLGGIINPNAIGKYAQGLMSFTSGLLDIFIALIASIYMLIDKDRILAGIYRVISTFIKDNRLKGFFERSSKINTIFTQYIYSRLICCTVMAVVCSLVLALMGERYALLLGIFIGFMDMIPYFGSIISWFVSAVVMAISGGVWHAVWCSAIMLIMQQIDGNVLAPKIMGDRLEIRPLAVIVAVSVGGSLFGFVGMLISVPVVAILRLTASEFLESREKAAKVSDNNKKTTV
jgi:predicted PurR-regulated permease PerM